MIEALLVPLDGSDLARCSLPLAAGVARRAGARIVLARVHERHLEARLAVAAAGLSPDDASDVSDAELRLRAEEELERTGEELREAWGCDVSTRFLDGPVREALTDVAAREGVDMVFMTTHGRSGLRRILLGSVADELVRSTTLPVVLVHPACEATVQDDGEPIRHILLPLDGSTVAERILSPATDLARALGARITLTNVVSIESVFGPRPVRLLRHRSERRWARAYLDAVARRMEGTGLDVAVEATLGKAPATTIVETADRLDAHLIGIATRGFQGIRRAVRGSVADQLLHHAQRPMLVVTGRDGS